MINFEHDKESFKKIQKQMSVRQRYYFYFLHSIQWNILIFIYSRKKNYFFYNIFTIIIQQFISVKLLLVVTGK